jgi:ion channel POLLUX/CASTOR
VPNSNLKSRIRYFFDSTLSAGPLGLLIWLGLFASTVIISVSCFVWIVGASPNDSIIEQVWYYMVSSIGATDADTGGSWLFRLSSLVVIFSGIFVIGTLISILTTAIDNKLEQLKKGRSRVIESGHSLILGWNEEILILIRELVIANENHPKSCITILANEDKILMEGKIRDFLVPQKNTRIVCRSGHPSSISDLELVSINTAKSIVILGPSKDNTDLFVLKTVLAIIKNPNRRVEPYNVVTAIESQKVMDSIKLISNDEVEVIHKGDFVTKIEAQTLLQAGLSLVITDLLDFKGDEIYFKTEPKLIGKSYKDIVNSYITSSVIGYKKFNNKIILNPTQNTFLEKGDQVIAISNDDDTIIISEPNELKLNENAINLKNFEPPKAENLLLLGWNRHTIRLINHIKDNTPKGSHVVVAANCENSKDEVKKFISTESLTIEHIKIDPTERAHLEKLSLANINHVLILPNLDHKVGTSQMSINQIDANTLVTLLNLREIRHINNYQLTITSELLDIENRMLVETKDNDDFVVSDHLVSLAMAQISENKSLGPIFNSLFDPHDNEIYLKPVKNYINIDEPANFFTILNSALLQNETAIGYRIKLTNNSATSIKDKFKIILNPDKRVQIIFNSEDKIIVLADDGVNKINN